MCQQAWRTDGGKEQCIEPGDRVLVHDGSAVCEDRVAKFPGAKRYDDKVGSWVLYTLEHGWWREDLLEPICPKS